jgi:hypothetical protein
MCYLPYNVDSFPTAKELHRLSNEVNSGGKQEGHHGTRMRQV